MHARAAKHWSSLAGLLLLLGCADPKHNPTRRVGRSTLAFAHTVIAQLDIAQTREDDALRPRVTRDRSLAQHAAHFGIPVGYVAMTVSGIAATTGGRAVLLVQKAQKRMVPIFVGDAEALAIELRLEKRHFTRPLTHDLVDSVLAELGGTIESARVDRMENSTFYGTLVVKNGTREIELDARSSDAIALAIGSGAPIYVSEQVLEAAGVDLSDLIQPDQDASKASDGRRQISL